MTKKRKSAELAKPGASPKGSAAVPKSVDMDIDSFLEGGFEALSDARLLKAGGAEKPLPSNPQEPTAAAGPQADAHVAQEAVEVKPKKKKKKKKAKAQKAETQQTSKDNSSPAEVGEADDVKPPKSDGVQSSAPSAVQRQLKSHKDELEALKLADPSFYEYLQQSDKSLLDFDEDGAEDDDGAQESDEEALDDQDDEDAEPSPKPSKPKTAEEASAQRAGQQAAAADDEEKPRGYVDTASMKRWCTGAKKDATLGAVRRVVQLFRTACHYGDPARDDDDSSMRIASDSAFQHILVFTLTEADSFFRKLLSLEPGCAHLPAATFKSAKWRKVGPLIKSYLGNTLHLLTHLAEEHSSAFILRRLRASSPFLQPFDALQRKLLKLVAGLFGSSNSRRVRVQALLWLRDFGLAGGPKALPAVLTASYRAYVASSRIVTSASVPDLSFMVSGIVELYGLDLEASYEAMFGFVSQLAGLVRGAMTAKTAEAYKQAYNWRTVNCLELWGRVVAAHATQGELQPLVYPVVQLLLAAARLVASPRWFPIRLRLARILTAVASATHQFVPVVPLLLEVLMWPGFSKPVSGVGKCPTLSLQLRLSKANLTSPAVQQALVEQTMEVLAGALALYARNPAFPELSHLPMLSLRRFIKSSPVDKFRSQATLLVHAAEAQAKLVGMERDGVDFAPKDLAAVSTFLRDKPDSSMPLIKFACKLAETATESRNTAGVETQAMRPEEDEQELRDTPDLLVPASVAHADDDGHEETTDDLNEPTDHMEDVVEKFVLSDDEDEDMHVEQTGADNREGKAHGGGGKKKNGSKKSRAGSSMKTSRKITVNPASNVRKSQGKAKSRKK